MTCKSGRARFCLSHATVTSGVVWTASADRAGVSPNDVMTAHKNVAHHNFQTLHMFISRFSESDRTIGAATTLGNAMPTSHGGQG